MIEIGNILDIPMNVLTATASIAQPASQPFLLTYAHSGMKTKAPKKSNIINLCSRKP